MARSKEYLAIKNFIHNEMGLSKSEFKDIMIVAIKEEAKIFVNREVQKFPAALFETELKAGISKEVKNLLSGGTYSTNSRDLMKQIGTQVVSQLDINLKER